MLTRFVIVLSTLCAANGVDTALDRFQEGLTSAGWMWLASAATNVAVLGHTIYRMQYPKTPKKQ